MYILFFLLKGAGVLFTSSLMDYLQEMEFLVPGICSNHPLGI